MLDGQRTARVPQSLALGLKHVHAATPNLAN